MLKFMPAPALAIVKQRAAQQAEVNKLYYTGYTEEAQAKLRQIAQENATEYDDYEDPEWIMGDVSALVEHRGQTQARPGDVVLLHQDMIGVVFFYSIRIAHQCVAGGGVKPFIGWDEAFDYWRSQDGKPKATWIVDHSDQEEPVPVEQDWEPPAQDEEEP